MHPVAHPITHTCYAVRIWRTKSHPHNFVGAFRWNAQFHSTASQSSSGDCGGRSIGSSAKTPYVSRSACFHSCSVKPLFWGPLNHPANTAPGATYRVSAGAPHHLTLLVTTCTCSSTGYSLSIISPCAFYADRLTLTQYRRGVSLERPMAQLEEVCKRTRLVMKATEITDRLMRNSSIAT